MRLPTKIAAAAFLSLAGACASSTPPPDDAPPTAAEPPKPSAQSGAKAGPRPAGPAPENPRLNEAKKLAQKKDFAGAIKAVQTVLAEEPNMEEGYLLLVGLCEMKEDGGCAQEALSKGLEVLPDSWALLHARGRTHLEANEIPAAVQDLERAHSLSEGSSAEVMADLAYAYVFVERLDEAELIAAAARRLDPKSFAAAYSHGEALLRREKWQEALEAYEGALSAEPGNPIAKRRKALVLAKLGQDDKALAIYGELIVGDGAKDATLHAARASSLMKLNKTGEALKAMREAVKLAPKDKKMLELLAQIEEASGDKKAAKATRAKAKSLGGE